MVIHITAITGYLGAGKTTLILSLLPQLPKDYKIVLLKNEFGNVEVDSQLAKASNLAGVSEILNGCMCCILVGQMFDACLEIRDKYNPDRIIIECSGSAFPATLAFQLRELERQTKGDFKLDAIITVVDAENFTGYEDTSPTAVMQASYSDLILINKWENVPERQLETVLDHLHTLNDTTPKIRCRGRNGVEPSLIFGLGTSLGLEEARPVEEVHDEVETLTVYRGSLRARPHRHHGADCDCHSPEDGVEDSTELELLEDAVLTEALSKVPKESVWRIKGFVRLKSDGRLHILNWAFGRYDLTAIEGGEEEEFIVKLNIIGERGELKRRIKPFARELRADII